jgi:hypothetical protein
MWKYPNQFWTWQVAKSGLLKKMAHIYFHQIKKIKLTFNLCSDIGKNEAIEKDGPNLLERFLIL